MSKVFEYFNEFNEGDEPCCEGDVNNNCTCGEVEPTKEDIPGFEGTWNGLEELY
tara:strand:- start:307 stop:468 length:162 start_codon:yes stop_codon:yes gene_type:complete